jgi:hypothetical protein
MESLPNPKVVGATIIGFALVAGAYVVNNFGQSYQPSQSAVAQASVPTPRVAIPVSDNDNNGIEDWRDTFVTAEPIIINQTDQPYTPPATITGQMSIQFMEGVIRSKYYGSFANSEEEVIRRTITGLTKEASDRLYGKADITIMRDWNEADIVNYANTLANILYTNSVPDLESEVLILRDIVNNKNVSRMSELKTLVNVYRNYRDDTLKLPVPDFMAKQHLDLINTYHAILSDIEAMTLAFDDPAVTLLRLKRYEEDATGLALALQNIYLALEEHYDLFKLEDPAMLFVLFGPNYNN